MDPKEYFSSIGLLDRLVVKRMGHQESKKNCTHWAWHRIPVVIMFDFQKSRGFEFPTDVSTFHWNTPIGKGKTYKPEGFHVSSKRLYKLSSYCHPSYYFWSLGYQFPLSLSQRFFHWNWTNGYFKASFLVAMLHAEASKHWRVHLLLLHVRQETELLLSVILVVY